MSSHAAADAFARDLSTVIFLALFVFVAVSATVALYRHHRVPGAGHPLSPPPGRAPRDDYDAIRPEFLEALHDTDALQVKFRKPERGHR